MWGYEIIKSLSPLKKIGFKGVYKSDTKILLDVGELVIIHSKESEKDVGHWACVFRASEETFEIFDSLGFKKKRVKNAINYPCRLVYNKYRVSSVGATNCGTFACCFAEYRLSNPDLPFNVILSMILVAPDKPRQNDKKIRRLFRQLFQESSDG